VSSEIAEISRIRITVLRFSDRTVVDVHVEDVDPDASQWTVGLSIEVPTGDPRIVLLIELISAPPITPPPSDPALSEAARAR